MAMHRYMVIGVWLVGFLFLAESCKDAGNEPRVPPPSALVIGQNNFSLVPGGTAAAHLSGGTLPYSIVSRGDTTVVVPSVVGDSLKLRAVARGSSTITIGDNSTPRFTVTLSVTVTELAVGQTSFNLVVGQLAATLISGGTPPYSLTSRGDTTVVAPSIVGDSLKLRAVGLGNSAIVVGDNSSPRLIATVNVNVTGISFTLQVQPIFTAGCAISGCHLPGGSGPMSLATGVSYGTLVGVNATGGPCAGDKRVRPGDASASALIKRLEGTCGTRMPIGASPLSTAQIQMIRDWITQGAQNN